MNNLYQNFTDKELIGILSMSPDATAIYATEQLIIRYANDKMLAFWGRTQDILLKPLEEAVPELSGQQFIRLLKEVWNTGVTYQATDTPAEVLIDGRMKLSYYDFTYRPVKNEKGEVYCILHTAADVTGRNLHRQAMAEALELTNFLENEKALNEELTAANEELNATNEKMLVMQQNLQELNNELEQRVADRVKDLAASKKLLDEILHQLPAPVAVLSGENQVVELTNASILSFWNKTRDEVIGKPILDVFPELASQPFPAQWKDVLRTGIPIQNREKPVVFNKANGPRQYYVDYYYQPLTDYNGQRTSIMATVIDVTDRIESRQQLEENQIKLLDLNDELSVMNEEMAATNEELITINEELAGTREDLLKTITEQERARKQLQQAEEMLRLSVEAANVGTWFLNNSTKEFYASAQLKKLFGYHEDEEINYMDAISHIPESHRSDVIRAIGSSPLEETHYNIEFPVIRKGEEHFTWIKALGKVETESDGTLSHFSGVIIDVTEQKEDELRKNDFIGMVSHELKTPLTSLNGYTQILHQKALKSGDRFTISALEKVTSQIKKMTSLINGFLNISRLESGKIHLQKENFYIDELVKELAEESMLTSSGYQISITRSDHVSVYADRDKIGSVISNLLSNAIKYSPLSKEIEVWCEFISDTARITVKDQGMGIRPNDLEKLFDRFYRVEGNQNQHISGFGIGLYLSAEIIERHDGVIAVTSEIGQGSTFHFSLPVTPP